MQAILSQLFFARVCQVRHLTRARAVLIKGQQGLPTGGPAFRALFCSVLFCSRACCVGGCACSYAASAEDLSLSCCSSQSTPSPILDLKHGSCCNNLLGCRCCCWCRCRGCCASSAAATAIVEVNAVAACVGVLLHLEIVQRHAELSEHGVAEVLQLACKARLLPVSAVTARRQGSTRYHKTTAVNRPSISFFNFSLRSSTAFCSVSTCRATARLVGSCSSAVFMSAAVGAQPRRASTSGDEQGGTASHVGTSAAYL